MKQQRLVFNYIIYFNIIILCNILNDSSFVFICWTYSIIFLSLLSSVPKRKLDVLQTKLNISHFFDGALLLINISCARPRNFEKIAALRVALASGYWIFLVNMLSTVVIKIFLYLRQRNCIEINFKKLVIHDFHFIRLFKQTFYGNWIWFRHTNLLL